MRHYILPLIFSLFAAILPASERVTVVIEPGVGLDRAGQTLRKALNDLELSAQVGGPAPIQLKFSEGDSRELPNGIRMTVMGDDGKSVQFLVMKGADAEIFTLKTGEKVGFLGWSIKAMKRDFFKNREFLIEPMTEGGAAKTRITGDVPRNTLTIISPDVRVLEFSEVFLESMNRGRSPSESSRIAQIAVGASDAPERQSRFDSNPPRGQIPDSAMIKLRLVRGSSTLIGELESSLAFDSAGRTPDRPRIGARSGRDGGEITLGSPGDRFQAKLRAMEQTGEISSESDAFLRVPIGGDGSLALSRGGGQLGMYVQVEPRGADRVSIEVDSENGDWSFLGSVNTTVNLRDGQTRLLAKNTSSRTTSSSSGVPLFGQLPFAGPLFRSERRSSSNESYALFITADLDY